MSWLDAKNLPDTDKEVGGRPGKSDELRSCKKSLIWVHKSSSATLIAYGEEEIIKVESFTLLIVSR